MDDKTRPKTDRAIRTLEMTDLIKKERCDFVADLLLKALKEKNMNRILMKNSLFLQH